MLLNGLHRSLKTLEAEMSKILLKQRSASVYKFNVQKKSNNNNYESIWKAYINIYCWLLKTYVKSRPCSVTEQSGTIFKTAFFRYWSRPSDVKTWFIDSGLGGWRGGSKDKERNKTIAIYYTFVEIIFASFMFGIVGGKRTTNGCQFKDFPRHWGLVVKLPKTVRYFMVPD